MMSNHFRLHLSSFDATLSVFGNVFSIFEVGSLFVLFDQLNLAGVRSKLAMFTSTPKREI